MIYWDLLYVDIEGFKPPTSHVYQKLSLPQDQLDLSRPPDVKQPPINHSSMGGLHIFETLDVLNIVGMGSFSFPLD